MRKITWLFLVLFQFAAQADEGMWVYNNLPVKQIQDRYGFTVTDAWRDHLMKSSVRFNSGGSGSFISSNGLVLTNHHVAAPTLQKIPKGKIDFYTDLFLARTPAEEIPLKGLELNQLVSIEEVTAEVQKSVSSQMNSAQANDARRAAIAKIEKESFEKTGFRSDVVTLYQGGQYHLYRYKVYTDVRLVFTPELQIAFFGGDPENFEFPRYNLDMAIFRVYENGAPAKTDNFFKWAPKGVAENDLIFVSGHPGTTNRMYSTAALEFLRDHRFTYMLDWLLRRESVLSVFSGYGVEQRSHAQEDLFSVQNSRKVYLGMLKGLQEESFFERKQAEEYRLRADILASPRSKELSGAWTRLVNAQNVHAKILKRRGILETGHGFDSRLFKIARTLVRLAQENGKPNSDRLPAYRDSGRSSLEQSLYSDEAIFKDLEIALLTHSLSFFAQEFGYEHPLVKEVLAGRSAAAVAASVVNGTTLENVNVRKVIAAGGLAEIKASKDPMIRMALAVDKAARAVEKQYQEKVAEEEKQAYAQIASGVFAMRGADTYPDATFTLRLAYGTVKGYSPDGGAKVEPFTTLGGAFAHEAKHGAIFPWVLPETWTRAKSTLSPSVSFNFVSTADIIGGNSGSPVLNKDGELVGLIFDGNIDSLTANYMYDDKVSRAISVDAAGMWEAMKVVYGATELLNEIGK